MNDTDQTMPYVKPEYPQSEITGRIIAAAQQVHRTLKPGFEEVIHQCALALELPGQVSVLIQISASVVLLSNVAGN
ncbi:MAG: GxxExxY protein [Anaerolineales bacterium]|nr:GxxExxY protein [Anaerolineales bacterium]